jgi:hypothetical protein
MFGVYNVQAFLFIYRSLVLRHEGLNTVFSRYGLKCTNKENTGESEF